MHLSPRAIKLLKLNLTAYWASVIIAIIFFMNTTLGYYHVIGGGLILLAHIAETFIFNSTLQAHSNNIIKDKLLMLPFGFIIPQTLKQEAKAES